METYNEIIQNIQKNVVIASQSAALAKIYASMCRGNPHVARIRDAVARGDECVISLEPLTYSSVLTSCGHVFSREGILQWVKRRVTRSFQHVSFDCPVCRQMCTIVYS